MHGEPQHVSSSELVWDRIGPWKRVIATRAFVERDRPVPGVSSITAVVDYDVPARDISFVRELEGDLEVDAAQHEVMARGPNLRVNLLAINLMDAVLTGEMTTEQARERYVAALLEEAGGGEPPEEMTEVRFARDVTSGEPRHIEPSQFPFV